LVLLKTSHIELNMVWTSSPLKGPPMYAERRFNYLDVGAQSKADASRTLRGPT
jgi:hypothetical protein